MPIKACNSGVLAAPATLLFDLLAKVGNHNAKGEYYLTDIVGLATEAGAARCARRSRRRTPSMAPTRQAELAEAEAAFQAAAAPS